MNTKMIQHINLKDIAVRERSIFYKSSNLIF